MIEAGLGEAVAHDTGGRRRSADVAEADEADADRAHGGMLPCGHGDSVPRRGR
jgi:hypothetical protein